MKKMLLLPVMGAFLFGCVPDYKHSNPFDPELYDYCTFPAEATSISQGILLVWDMDYQRTGNINVEFSIWRKKEGSATSPVPVTSRFAGGYYIPNPLCSAWDNCFLDTDVVEQSTYMYYIIAETPEKDPVCISNMLTVTYTGGATSTTQSQIELCGSAFVEGMTPERKIFHDLNLNQVVVYGQRNELLLIPVPFSNPLSYYAVVPPTATGYYMDAVPLDFDADGFTDYAFVIGSTFYVVSENSLELATHPITDTEMTSMYLLQLNGTDFFVAGYNNSMRGWTVSMFYYPSPPTSAIERYTKVYTSAVFVSPPVYLEDDYQRIPHIGYFILFDPQDPSSPPAAFAVSDLAGKEVYSITFPVNSFLDIASGDLDGEGVLDDTVILIDNHKAVYIDFTSQISSVFSPGISASRVIVAEVNSDSVMEAIFFGAEGFEVTSATAGPIPGLSFKEKPVVDMLAVELDQDGTAELITITSDEILTFDHTPSGTLELVPQLSLSLSTTGEFQRALIADFGSDGRAELIISDTDSYLHCFRFPPETFLPAGTLWRMYGGDLWNRRTPEIF